MEQDTSTYSVAQRSQRAEFTTYQEWSEYGVEHDFPQFFSPKIVGTYPKGIRRGVWPLILEEYISDREPRFSSTDAKAPNRIVIWQRVHEIPFGRGWHQFSQTPRAVRGFVELIPSESFAKKWSRKAKYERLQWLKLCKANTYRIEELPFSELEALYKKSTVYKQVGFYQLSAVGRKIAANPKAITIFGARHVPSNTVVAGMAVINSPSNAGSFYAVGCKLESDESPAMIGLFNHWFEVSLAHNIRFLHLGLFWNPGKPHSWKGFSQFKMKFKPELITFPPPLYTFVRGTLF